MSFVNPWGPKSPISSLENDIGALLRRNAQLDDEMESHIDCMKTAAREKAENAMRLAEFQRAVERLKQADAQNSKTTGFAA